MTVGLFGASLYGNYSLEQEFDPWLFLDPDSYVAQFKATTDEFYPDKGEAVLLFFSGNITKANLAAMDALMTNLSNQTHIIKDLNSWYTSFEDYFVNQLDHQNGLFDGNTSISMIKDGLAQFLYSPNGARYQYLFTFGQDLKCGQDLPPVYVSTQNSNLYFFKYILKKCFGGKTDLHFSNILARDKN
jgi:hypothetical protein